MPSMSRGIGKKQWEIKRILQRAFDAKLGMLRFADIRAVFILQAGGNPEMDRMNPYFERSLKRSLKALVDSGDVLLDGKGGQADPFRYSTVEVFTDEPDTKEAKRVWKEMSVAIAAYMSRQ